MLLVATWCYNFVSHGQLVNVQPMLAGGFFPFSFSVRQFVHARQRCWREIFSLLFLFPFSFLLLFLERQFVNLQAPMVLAGDLNLSVKLSHASFDTEPFAIASSLGCPRKRGLCTQRLCMCVCVREREREKERESVGEGE